MIVLCGVYFELVDFSRLRALIASPRQPSLETVEWQTACGNAGIGDGAVDVDENFPIIIIDIVDACSST